MCCQPPLDIATMDHVRVSIIRTAWILIGKLVKTKVPESHEYTEPFCLQKSGGQYLAALLNFV